MMQNCLHSLELTNRDPTPFPTSPIRRVLISFNNLRLHTSPAPSPSDPITLRINYGSHRLFTVKYAADYQQQHHYYFLSGNLIELFVHDAAFGLALRNF
ncbi:hypothetical protein GWI33_003790 [Rhynchophorus ferrugineus]|uniref:Uncharacterized protein n=1 Tax=Rhynchophorus ferrugineus TaxID=354439 RepID=A0A834M2S1_RHYFE|nr:hypothetical protein GWI33_003790 [Rhynchophorus ferrugineus]